VVVVLVEQEGVEDVEFGGRAWDADGASCWEGVIFDEEEGVLRNSGGGS